jgi:biotin carboxylase
MQAIVFLGTLKSGSSREALRAASKMGYYTILLTDRQSHLEQRNEFPEVNDILLCDLHNFQEIRLSLLTLNLRFIKIAAVVSFTEAHCLTACLMADELGLNHFTCHAIESMKSKITSREILAMTDYCPRFMVVSKLDETADMESYMQYPFIIKLPDSTGSADVFKIHNRQELYYYFHWLKKKHPLELILIEELIDGPQYLIEVLVHEKKVQIAAIIEQEVTYFQRFIITGYNLLVDLPEKLKDLPEAVSEIVQAHGIESGACHLEMRLVNQQWKLIEINPRISGGAMNKLIYLGLGIDLTAETLKLALGQEPDVTPHYKRHIFVQYRTVAQSGILDKVTGMHQAAKSEGVMEVYVKPRRGAYLKPPLSMGNRYAYVIASGDSEDEARHNAKEAAMKIQFWMYNTKAENIKINQSVVMPNPHNSIRFHQNVLM